MSFVEFLIEYYFYIVAVLIVLIVGVIGFLVDSKNKKKNVVQETVNSSVGQVINNVDPLQGTPINNGLSNGIANMQPVGVDLVPNQVQPPIQNNDLNVNGGVSNQNAAMAINNDMLGMNSVITSNGESIAVNMANNQSMGTNVQANLNSQQVMGIQSIQPIVTNNGMNPVGVNNNLNDISVLQGVQPTLTNNNVSSAAMPLDSNLIGSQSMQVNSSNVLTNPSVISNVQSQVSNNVGQPMNNQIEVSSNGINNISSINGMNPQTSIPSGIPVSPIGDVVNQNNNSNTNVGNNIIGVPSSAVDNIQSNNSNMNNSMNGMNGQVYIANNSQPFDISSMFGNNQQ